LHVATSAATSDVDLLVDLPDGRKPLRFVRLQFDLERRLKRKVDIVPANSISLLFETAFFLKPAPL